MHSVCVYGGPADEYGTRAPVSNNYATRLRRKDALKNMRLCAREFTSSSMSHCRQVSSLEPYNLSQNACLEISIMLWSVDILSYQLDAHHLSRKTPAAMSISYLELLSTLEYVLEGSM